MTKRNLFSVIQIATMFLLIAPLVTLATGGGGSGRLPTEPEPEPEPLDPQPFACGWESVTYVERLPETNFNGLHLSTTSNGIHRISGQTRNGEHTCEEIRETIKDYNICIDSTPIVRFFSSYPEDCAFDAYPESVDNEELQRISWTLNEVELHRDGGNIKAPLKGTAPTGIYLYGGFPSSPNSYREYSTILQERAPFQRRNGGIFHFSTVSVNESFAPSFIYNLETIDRVDSLRIARTYELYFTEANYGASTRQRTGPFWTEYNYNVFFKYEPRLASGSLVADSFEIQNRNDGSPNIYEDSPIRMSWQKHLSNAAVCSLETTQNGGSTDQFSNDNITY